MFLILDNLNVHKAKLVRAWLEANEKKIQVYYLPPYTPERNPSEYHNLLEPFIDPHEAKAILKVSYLTRGMPPL